MSGFPSELVENRNLFSKHFLINLLPRLPEWSLDDHEHTFHELKRRYEAEKPFLQDLNEPQLEERFFRPLFKALGFVPEVQEVVEGAGEFPDYALFESREELNRAHKGSHAFYDRALAVGEVKRWDIPLDRFGRDKHNRHRNPSYQIWHYLRLTKPSWGILSNGRKWRLYHTDRQVDCFYEVDLAAILDRKDVDSFRYFHHFFSKDSFLSRQELDPFVDRVLRGSEDYAREVGENLKENVYRALRILAQGFFDRPENNLDINKGEHRSVVQQNVMRLLYRLLFILYAEGRELLGGRAYIESSYSLYGLKHEIAKRKDRGDPILPTTKGYWSFIKDLFSLVDRGSEAYGIPRDQFYVPAYNGGLFDSHLNPFLETKVLGDRSVAEAIDLLARASAKDEPLGFVDYSTLDIRHLGSIYEGLLEYRLEVASERMVVTGKRLLWVPYEQYAQERRRAVPFDQFERDDRARPGELYVGTQRGERKATGSYYTPSHIVEYIVDHTVGPILDGKWQAAREKGISLSEATLSLRIIDPAMGSGHFLVGAVEYLAARLLQAIQEDWEAGRLKDDDITGMTPDWAKRQVLAHCIYGVDRNDLAVELAKLSLWLATISKDKPLGFLDHRLKTGNSLVGARLQDLPYYPSEFLPPRRGRAAKAPGQRRLETTPFLDHLRSIVSRIDQIADETRQDIEAKKALFEELVRSDEYLRIKHLADIRTAIYFGARPGERSDAIRQYGNLTWAILKGDKQQWENEVRSGWRRHALEISKDELFFHWELEFPDVFQGEDPGFDAVVGNPPYVNALEFARTGNPLERQYLRCSYSSTKGAFDLYIPFLELGPRLSTVGGRCGLITPNKFLSSPYGKEFRKLASKQLILSRVLDASRAEVFEDSSVYPIVTIFENRPAQKDAKVQVEVLGPGEAQPTPKGEYPHKGLTIFPERLWSFLLSGNPSLMIGLTERCLHLSDVAKVQASTTAAEADVFTGILLDCPNNASTDEHYPVLNTGLIDRYQSKWGIEKLTHAGRTYLRPCIKKREEALSSRRRALFSKPKLIVAKVAYVPEVCLDAEGKFAAVNVNFVLDSEFDLRLLLAILNSRLMSYVYREYFGALTMQGGYAQFQAPQLRVLPIPKMDTEESLEDSRAKADLKSFYSSVIENASAEDEPLESVVPKIADRASTEEVHHVLLPWLAEALVEIQNQRWRVVRGFLDWLQSPVGIDVNLDDLNGRTKIYGFHEDPTLGSEAARNVVEAVLSDNDIRLDTERLQLLRQEYAKASKALSAILKRAELTDALIDLFVYQVYGLNAEEVAAVEGGGENDVASAYGDLKSRRDSA